MAAASGWPKMPKTPHSRAGGRRRERTLRRAGARGLDCPLSPHTCSRLRQWFRSLVGIAVGRILIVRLRSLQPLKMVLSGRPATSTSAIVPCFAARLSTWRCAPIPVGRGRAPAMRKEECDDNDDGPRPAEKKTERAVECTDPAVEYHVGNARGNDRDDQSVPRKRRRPLRQLQPCHC